MMATAVIQDEIDTHSDEAWGYRFGVDGLRTKATASEFLDVSRWTLYRLIKANKIREAKDGRICYRSLVNYAHSLEK